MATTVRLRPSRPELLVAYPGRPAQHLAAGGELVELTSYWRRRLAEGDVTQVEEPAPQPKTKPKD